MGGYRPITTKRGIEPELPGEVHIAGIIGCSISPHQVWTQMEGPGFGVSTDTAILHSGHLGCRGRMNRRDWPVPSVPVPRFRGGTLRSWIVGGLGAPGTVDSVATGGAGVCGTGTTGTAGACNATAGWPVGHVGQVGWTVTAS